MIAPGMQNGALKVLDSYTKEVLFEDAGAVEKSIYCVLFSPDSSCLATSFMLGWWVTLRIWNARPWTTEHELSVLPGKRSGFLFYPKGRFILSCSRFGILEHLDQRRGIIYLRPVSFPISTG